MRKLIGIIAASSALAFGDTTRVSASFLWIEDLTCTVCTIEKVMIMQTPGYFQIGPWWDGTGEPMNATELQGNFLVNGTAGSLPIINPGMAELLHSTKPQDTAIFRMKPRTQGKYFIRFTADETTALTPGKPVAARSPLPWGNRGGYSVLGRWMPPRARR
jgi:hypothetical protein